METVDIYTDGTYKSYENIASWGFIVIHNNKEIHREKGIVNDKDTLLGWQVGAELEAVIRGVEYCKANNYKCNIFYDYTGVFNWVKDLFNKGKSWKTKKTYTKKYREFISKNLPNINSYNWVKGHNGNFYNEEVDNFIK
jgi:ribonuclease HI